jgi:hypothetical protein
MDTRRIYLVLLALLLPVVAQADRHRMGGRLGLTDARRSNLWGVGTSFDLPLVLKRDASAPTGRGEDHTFSAIVELSIVWGTHDGEDLTQFTYLSGLRYSLNKIPWRKLELYVQGLVGGWHSNREDVRDLPVAAVGAGLYYPFNGEKVGVSLQVDRYLPQGPPEAYTQISLGLVLRHHKH